ncbi:alpha-2,8-polysialyltransferase family protein [bacterium]|nr:alpha-2,8-polysialyltransferase family protein [bacterium]
MALRIFVSSSCIATVYMAIYAAETWEEGFTDWLMVDALPLRPSQQKLINQAATLHDFARVFDFSSEKSEAASPVPSLSKRLTRMLKTKPVFKQVYDFLYGFKMKGEEKALREKILETTRLNPGIYEEVSLHMQPVLHLNKSLFSIFPEGKVHYFEHGLGDYLDISSRIKEGEKFHCIFPHTFRSFLSAKSEESQFVVPTFTGKGFHHVALQFERAFPQIKLARPVPDAAIALILTQSFEEYGVDNAFWPYFLDLCLAKIPDPTALQFIIKPHPRQSREVLTLIESYFEEKGLQYQLFDVPEVRSLSVEILFQSWKDHVKWVFSPFSSSVFYLAELYPGLGANYHYAMKGLDTFSKNSPDFYRKRWQETSVYIREVFGKELEELG